MICGENANLCGLNIRFYCYICYVTNIFGAKPFFWLVVSTILKNMKVKWDDYSQYMEKNMFQTTNQLFVATLW